MQHSEGAKLFLDGQAVVVSTSKIRTHARDDDDHRLWQ